MTAKVVAKGLVRDARSKIVRVETGVPVVRSACPNAWWIRTSPFCERYGRLH